MFPEPEMIRSNGIELAVHRRGEGPAVVFLHGFPELAYSWRFQLAPVAAAGFMAIAPDLRGYGGSSKPESIEDYALNALSADITGLLDALGLERAFLVGHDWGALLAWHIALIAPDRLDGVAALNIPFFPRPPVEPIAYMRENFGDDFYIVNFQDSDLADRRCDDDPGRVFDALMRRGAIRRSEFETLPRAMRQFSLLAALDREERRGDALLTPAERAVYVAAFERGGFSAPINYYRNFTRNWQASDGVEQLIRVPALFIGAVDDVIIAPHQIEAMRPHVPDLEMHMLEDTGHWSQQERPDEVNRILTDWLRRRTV